MKIYFDGEFHGHVLSRDEFIGLVRRNPGKIYDDLVAQGCCGGPAVIFRRKGTRTIGIEDTGSDSVSIEPAA